jgi:hypothetical protein
VGYDTREHPGSLGLQVKEPKPPKPSSLNPRPPNSKQQRINSSPARLMSPEPTRMKPDRQHSMPSQLMPNQQGMKSNQQQTMPSQQGMNPNQPGIMPHHSETMADQHQMTSDQSKNPIDCWKNASIIDQAFPQISKYNDFSRLSDNVKELEISGCIKKRSCEDVKVQTFPGCIFEVVENGVMVGTLTLPVSKYTSGTNN